MSRTTAYLADRARILRMEIDENKRVVSSRNVKPLPTGDWIPARIRPVSGREVRADGMTKLEYSHEIVLNHHDASGNEVFVHEGDKLELRACRNQVLEDDSVVFKIAGAIRETRRRTRVVSYVIPAILESEY
jgi:hypothetical protein